MINKTESTAKSIKSITIYKGPIAKTYPINVPPNDSPSKRNFESKLTSAVSKEDDSSPFKLAFKSLRSSIGTGNMKELNLKLTDEKPLMYKANTRLPGTSTLIISQDIPHSSLRNSCHLIESPFSTSNRSSLKRPTLAEKPISCFSTAMNKEAKKTRNGNTPSETLHSLSVRFSPKKQIKKLIVHKNDGQQCKALVMTQKSLKQRSGEVKILNNKSKMSTMKHSTSNKM